MKIVEAKEDKDGLKIKCNESFNSNDAESLIRDWFWKYCGDVDAFDRRSSQRKCIDELANDLDENSGYVDECYNDIVGELSGYNSTSDEDKFVKLIIDTLKDCANQYLNESANC